MQGQGTGKKGFKWLLIAAAALVLVAAVVLGVVLFGGSEAGQKTPDDIVLYWNVERSQYVAKGMNGLSGRTARSDGYYYVRFAVGGEQLDLQVADADLVQKIDQLDVMGLEFDDQGIVTGAYNINECTGGLVASSLYVKSVEGNTLYCNTQGGFKGIDVKVEMTGDTQVYDVGQSGLLCGMETTVDVDHEIMAVRDYQGNIIYIFTKGFAQPGDVYWNLERKYDSTSKTSTREMDGTGCYVFEMAFNGGVVTVKTRDYKVANAIDAKAARCTGLVFDESGYVVEVTNASRTAGGTTFASWANVFGIDGNEVFCRKLSGSQEGTEYLGTLSDGCKVINVSGVGGELGSYTTLQYGDTVHGLTDARGRICYIWVISRLGGSDGWQLFWNVARKYDSTAKTTKRSPASDGYYYIEVATGGQKLTVKTQDKELVTKLDSYAARCFSMKLDENNEILRVGSANMIHGGGTFGSWYYVDAIDGRNLTVSRILDGDSQPTVLQGVMAEDVEIINGSSNYSSHCGEYASLKVGDRVHCLKDLEGNIRVIFIVEKTVPGPLYWNISKKTVTNGVTTRQRAEDGYFYFTMAGGGKQHTFKTKDVTIATKIDSTAARCMGLTVTSGGVIVKVHGTGAVEGSQGGTKKMSWVDVLSVSGSSIVAQKDPNSNTDTAGMIFATTMAYNCKVYNVSANNNLFCGEQTTVRVGDRIHVLHNKAGQATTIFVVERAKTLDEKNTCPCNTDVTWEPWDGTGTLEDGKYYYLTQDVTAPVDGFVLEGVTVSLRLDGHTISSQGRCFFIRPDSKLNICDHDTRGKLVGSGVEGESGGVIRVYSGSGVVNLWNIDLYNDGVEAKASEGGVISCSGVVSLYNCNVSGGKATSKGGNVQISSTGTFRMFGGTVAGGQAPASSSINGTGKTYLENVTVTDGLLTSNFDGDCIFNGLTADRMQVSKGTPRFMGDTQIKELILGEEAVLADGGIAAGSKILLVAKPLGSQIVMTGASETAYGALTSFAPEDYALSYDASRKTVTVTCTIVPQTHENSHCACAGNASGLGGHTCAELSGWTEITDQVFENAIGTDGSVTGIKFKQDGNYYLSLDYTSTKTVCIMPGQNITICLNGCGWTRENGQVFLVAGDLNVTDCTGKGTVSGSATTNGGAVKLVSQGKMDLFAGTLTATEECPKGGGVVVISTDGGKIVDNTVPVGSVFNMYGGTVTGGSAAEGGNIALWHDSFFNMYGGTVTGGTASGLGGNLQIKGNEDAHAKLMGGTITGGNAQQGAGISYTGGSLTIGGDMNISGNLGSDLYIAEGLTVTLQDYTCQSVISLEMEQAGTFALYESDISGRFTSLDTDYRVAYAGGALKLELNSTAQGHIHCLCGGTASGLYAHQCSNIAYEPWDGTTELTTGNYYLTDHVELTDAAGILVGTNQINLCLNGFTITNKVGRAAYLKNSGGSLNICDHAGNNGAVEAVGVAGEGGGLIRVGSISASFGAYNVTLRRIDEQPRVEVTEGGIITCAGKVQLYNTVLENGYSTKGGNLNMVNISKAVVVGCTFTGGETVKNVDGGDGTGGNIRIGGNNADDPATVTLIDSTVIGGKAESGGDGIYLAGSQKNLLQLGGKIIVTDNNGHNLYMGGTDNVALLDLSADSRIGISMNQAGVIAQSAQELPGCFVSDDDELEVFHDGSQLVLAPAGQKPHRAHCVCAGKTVDTADHSCEALTDWQAFSLELLETTSNANQVQISQSGSYYLENDVELTKEIIIPTDVQITICLNGHTMTGERRMFRVNGVLNITDCSADDSGKLQGMAARAPVFYGYAGGHINLFAGELSSVNETPATRNWGGVCALSNDKGMASAKAPSSFTMYGGKLIGASVIKDSSGKYGMGGALRVMSGSTFTMYGGQIIGGAAEVGGAAVAVDKNCEMIMLGGSITAGDQADRLVYLVDSTAKLTVGGQAKLANVYLPKNTKLLVSEEAPLSQDASIGVSMEAAGVFATVAAQTDKAFFVSFDTALETAAAENDGSYDLLLQAAD